eukprot:scaffold62613_cov84-Phaeocystis_antarctica.AAC.5
MATVSRPAPRHHAAASVAMLRCKRIALTVCLACVPAVLERNGHGGAVFAALTHGDPTTAHRAREKRHALQGRVRVGVRVRVRVRRTYCLGLLTCHLLLPTHYLQEDDVLSLRR